LPYRLTQTHWAPTPPRFSICPPPFPHGPLGFPSPFRHPCPVSPVSRAWRCPHTCPLLLPRSPESFSYYLHTPLFRLPHLHTFLTYPWFPTLFSCSSPVWFLVPVPLVLPLHTFTLYYLLFRIPSPHLTHRTVHTLVADVYLPYLLVLLPVHLVIPWFIVWLCVVIWFTLLATWFGRTHLHTHTHYTHTQFSTPGTKFLLPAPFFSVHLILLDAIALLP